VPLSGARLHSAIATVAIGALLAGRSAAADEPTKQQCVAANESAQDLERAGRLIEARLQLLTCASRACPGAVRQDCAEQLQAVGQAQPTIVLTPKDVGGGDVSAAALVVDGVTQSAALDGTPIPIDPGQHTLTVTLTGRLPVSLQLSFERGDRVRREVVFKTATGIAGKTTGSGVEGDGEAEAGAVSIRSAVSTGLTMRRIAWSAIGAGAAGMTLGTIFGFLALGKRGALDRKCSASMCPPASEEDIEGLHVNAVASNISFAVGLLGLGGGAALLFAFPESAEGNAPRTPSGAVVVRPWASVGHVGVRGTFR
jgi:hypothetical protein